MQHRHRRAIILAVAVAAALTGRAAGAPSEIPLKNTNKIAATLIAATLATAPGCAWFNKNVTPVVDDTIDCAKAEASTITSGKSAIEVAMSIATALENAYAAASGSGGDLTSALEAAVTSLVAQYGEPIVACVVKDLNGGGPTPTSAPKAGSPSPLDIIIANHHWTYKAAK